MKYRFTIWYASKNLQKVSELMGGLDLGMDGCCIEDVLTFEIKKDEQPSIAIIKEEIIKAFISDEFKVFKLEGGSIE